MTTSIPNDLNFEDFCQDSARVLLALMVQFPLPITLYIEDIVGPEPEDEFGIKSERYLRTLGSITWLAHEGYIRYSQQVQQEAFDETILTEQGLRLLMHPTPEQTTLLNQLRAQLDEPSLIPATMVNALFR
ncbi:hypothetical protein [Umboniibacter marinipuniceus]|uniref:Uncharacterized protein n=1 Tax=Umboniibacter marinipuniceus TaxID=569599 RepID=A0A3M0A249_9GAMM|nr:hypothetical protein [Umboniibacter marinipuniceus]RMA78716.1 hypothetical protein DFR27_2047 [Umboniibacter marinipuniceus]